MAIRKATRRKEEKQLNDEYEEQNDIKLSEKDNRRNWGKRASNFYSTSMDNHDSSTDDDESQADIEDEAVHIHHDTLEVMRPEDFELGLNFSSLVESETKEHEAVDELDILLDGLGVLNANSIQSQKLAEGLSKEELDLMVQRDHPELMKLLKEVTQKTEEMTEKLTPILERVECKKLLTSEGLSYLEMRQHLLLCYLQYLSYYVLLKLHGHSVADHPVIERLIETRTLLTSLRPVEAKLQPEINRLLQLKTTSHNQLRPRPELIGKSALDDQNALLVTDQDQTLLDSDDDTNEGDDTNEENNNIYKPPKLVSMDYVDDRGLTRRIEKEKDRRHQQLKKSELVEALREEFQTIPLELGSDTRSSKFNLGLDSGSATMLQREKEREEFEEDHMIRLPTTKAEKKARRLLKEKQRAFLSGGSTMDDLEAFADATLHSINDDPTLPTLNTKKGFEFTKSLNAARQAAEKLQRSEQQKKNQRNADVHVTAKAINRNKMNSSMDEETNYYSKGDNYELDTTRSDTSTHISIPDVVKEAFDRKAQKTQIQEDRKRAEAAAGAASFTLDETVDGKRGTNYAINKNKGLTRKRKKIEGNARVHNRVKYEKKLKKLKTTQVREGASSGGYDGETTGIRTHLKKSTNLAS